MEKEKKPYESLKNQLSFSNFTDKFNQLVQKNKPRNTSNLTK